MHRPLGKVLFFTSLVCLTFSTLLTHSTHASPKLLPGSLQTSSVLASPQLLLEDSLEKPQIDKALDLGELLVVYVIASGVIALTEIAMIIGNGLAVSSGILSRGWGISGLIVGGLGITLAVPFIPMLERSNIFLASVITGILGIATMSLALINMATGITTHTQSSTYAPTPGLSVIGFRGNF